MTKPRVLVVGAANFIGSRVVDALDFTDWAIPIPLNRGAKPAEEALHGVHGIVNAASGSPKSIRSQVRITASLAKASGPTTRLVHLSSMTVYGSLDRQVSETTEPVADLGAYAAAQIEAEQIALVHPNTVILRLGCEYGPGCPQWSERVARMLLAHRLGDLGAAGDGCCNLLYIDDLIAAILAALQRPAINGEIFNLAMRSPPTWNEYFIQFGIALRAVPIRRITTRRLAFETSALAAPLKALEVVAHRINATKTLAIPAITPSLIRLCKQQITMDVTKAEALLGTTWTSLNWGLEKASAAILAARGAESPRTSAR